jgi:hypothetical protein
MWNLPGNLHEEDKLFQTQLIEQLLSQRKVDIFHCHTLITLGIGPQANFDPSPPFKPKFACKGKTIKQTNQRRGGRNVASTKLGGVSMCHIMV